MKEAILALDRLHRIAHGTILEKTENKMFFTEYEFKKHQGKIMLMASDRGVVEKQIKLSETK